MIWLTADLHLDHANIIKYCHRPFKSAADMNDKLIRAIVDNVRPTDTLIVAGDTCLDPRMFDVYQAMLKGVTKDLIILQGNHDPKNHSNMRLLATDFRWNHRHYYVCHYPWATWRPNTVMLHGHSHGNAVVKNDDPRQANRIDVGVDCWDYNPVSIERIESVLV